MTDNVGCKFFNVIQHIYSLCQSAIKIDNKKYDYFKIEREVKQDDSLSLVYLNYYFVNDLHDILCIHLISLVPIFVDWEKGISWDS